MNNLLDFNKWLITIENYKIALSNTQLIKINYDDLLKTTKWNLISALIKHKLKNSCLIF